MCNSPTPSKEDKNQTTHKSSTSSQRKVITRTKEKTKITLLVHKNEKLDTVIHYIIT